LDIFVGYETLLECLGLLSVLTFLGSIVAIPWIIARLPVDYFISHRRKVTARHERHPIAARLIFVMRNLTGGLFLLAGILMLVLPGQGLITIVIGLSLMDFPKKHTLVDYLLRRPKVMKLLNWIRKKEKKPPFEF